MKILGADWSAFCKAIPDCYYFDESDYPTDYKPSDVIAVTSGQIAWQGPRSVENYAKYAVDGVISPAQVQGMIEDREEQPLLSAYRRWQRLQTMERLCIEVSKDQLEAVKMALTPFKVKYL